MQGRKADGGRKLTGVWQGLYSYPGGGPNVPFTATLIEAGPSISGSIHEPCVVGGSPSETLFASLLGTRSGGAVSFLKTYEGNNPNFQSQVRYDGTVNGDATEIEGRWDIRGVWSGKFLMIRSGDGPQAAVEREGATPSGAIRPEKADVR